MLESPGGGGCEHGEGGRRGAWTKAAAARRCEGVSTWRPPATSRDHPRAPALGTGGRRVPSRGPVSPSGDPATQEHKEPKLEAYRFDACGALGREAPPPTAKSRELQDGGTNSPIGLPWVQSLSQKAAAFGHPSPSAVSLQTELCQRPPSGVLESACVHCWIAVPASRRHRALRTNTFGVDPRTRVLP